MSAVAAIGHNNPPSASAPYVGRVNRITADAEALPAEITEANATLYREVQVTATKLAAEIEAERKRVKQPHLDACAAVDDEFRPFGDRLASIVKSARMALAAWADAEDRRRKREAAEAEARRVAAENARLAAEAEARRVAALEAEDDPFAEIAATEASPNAKAALAEAEHAATLAELEADHAAARASAAPSVSSAYGRAGSLRTNRKAKVTDARALVNHFAEHPTLIAEAEKLANAMIRAAKGGPVNIPGIEIEEVRSFV